MSEETSDPVNDPSRWSHDDPGATSLERELLRAGRGGAMPADEKRRVWAAIAGQLVPPPAGPAGSAGPAGGAGAGAGGALAKAASASALKAISLAAVVATGGGVWAYQTHRDVPPAKSAVAATSSAVVAEPAVATPPSPAVAPPEAVAPSSTKEHVRASSAFKSSASTSPDETAVPVPSGSQSRLADEAHAVVEARAALEAKNPGAALHLLEAARKAFPAGTLGQEREALTIEALARSGQAGAASTRAEAFLRRFPRSPHAGEVRRFVVPGTDVR